jgi:hypothetical protein
MTQREGFTFFEFFFEFLMLISKCDQNDGRDRSMVGMEFCKNLYGSMMK